MLVLCPVQNHIECFVGSVGATILWLLLDVLDELLRQWLDDIDQIVHDQLKLKVGLDHLLLEVTALLN